MGVFNSMDIINLALTRANLRRISSLEEKDKKEARVAAVEWDVCRDAVLRARPWNFAMRRDVPLARLAIVPRGFAYAYAMPADCVILSRLHIDVPHQIGSAGDRVALFTDAASARADYVGRVDNSTVFDAIFVEALAWRLAASFSLAVKNDTQFANACLQFYDGTLAEAGKLNATENGTDEQWESDLVRARSHWEGD